MFCLVVRVALESWYACVVGQACYQTPKQTIPVFWPQLFLSFFEFRMKIFVMKFSGDIMKAALSHVENRFCIQPHQSFNFFINSPPVMNFTFLVSRGDHPHCRLTNVRPPNLPERVAGPYQQSSTVQPSNNAGRKRSPRMSKILIIRDCFYLTS